MRIFRLISIFIVALSLSLSGITSHGYAKASHVHSEHHDLNIVKYADLVIDADDCQHAVTNDTANQPSNDTPCKKCCSACMTVSTLPSPIIMSACQFISRQIFTLPYNALIPHL